MTDTPDPDRHCRRPAGRATTADSVCRAAVSRDIWAKRITIITDTAIADTFAAHALELCPRVAMLLRLGFLASTRRTALLEDGSLARVHVFRDRPDFYGHEKEGWRQ